MVKNQRGNTYIWLIIFILIFIGVSTLVIDYGNLYVKTKKIKYAMNRSVKAASLQIKEGEELADGIFLIDETKAETVFYSVLAKNLGLDETTLVPKKNSILCEKPIVKELEVINSVPTTYISSGVKSTYEISKPSVVAVLCFKVKSTFLTANIVVDKQSGSQLTSKYD